MVPYALSAQSVRGTVRSAESAPSAGSGGASVALPEAMVELLNAQAVTVARARTNAAGQYVLQAPMSGAYRVRARQVGRAPVTSAVITLDASATAEVDLALELLAVRLAPVLVATRARCGGERPLTDEWLRALEDARTFLTRAQLTEDRTTLAYAVRMERVRDVRTVGVLGAAARESRTVVTGPLRTLWTSVTEDDLATLGYVTEYGRDSTIYRVPGLAVLASDRFVSEHCFRLGAAAGDSVGIEFVADGPTRAEVRGTFWLSAPSRALRAVDFRYVNVPDVVSDAGAGGRLEFLTTPSGEPAIREWQLHMPVLEQRPPLVVGRSTLRSQVMPVVIGVRDVRGVLSTLLVSDPVRVAVDTLWIHPLQVAGVVRDSVRNAAVPGAEVRIADLGLRDTTRADGAFRLGPLPPGRHEVTVHTPSLDSVLAASRFAITVTDNVEEVALKLPTAASVAADVCTNGAARARQLVLVRVRGEEDAIARGDPAREKGLETRVVFEWAADASATSATSGAKEWLDVRVDAAGVVRTCVLPADRALTVRAIRGGRTSREVSLAVAASSVRRADLELEATSVARALLTGTVVDSTNKPVSGAEVTLVDLNAVTRTNARGAFRFDAVPPGAHALRVRAIGYAPFDAAITLAAGERAARRITVGRVATLSEVDVTATRLDPAMRDFEENRRVGLGHFLTREDLEKQRNQRLSEIIQMTPGFRMARGQNSAYAVSSRGSRSMVSRCFEFEGTPPRGGGGCGCYPQVFLDKMPLFSGRDGDIVPDLARMRPDQIESVELYASAAQTPSQYSGLNSTCGVIVIHTRR
jgi:hypothetical protein